MPSRATVLCAVALTVAVTFAGCLDEPEGRQIRTGDFVEVAYVLRDAEGNLLESTLDPSRDGPPDIETVDAPDHDPVWWYVFNRERARSTSGQDRQIGAVFRDRFPADGRLDILVRGFADVADDETLTNRTSSLWNVPDPVVDPETSMLRGLHLRLEGQREGDVVEFAIPPDQAHGEVDPGKIQTYPRVVDGQERRVGPSSRENAADRVNLTQNTTEGDVVGYNILADNWVDARVDQINETHVTVHLLVENGTLLPRDDLWPGRIVEVNATHFSIEQVVEQGQTYTLQGQEGRIVEVTDDRFTIDFNHPSAGTSLHYTIAIQRVLPHDPDRHLRGEETTPFDGAPLHGLAWADEFSLLAATGSGVHFLSPPRPPWYGFSQATTGPEATALAIGPDAADVWVAQDDLLTSTDGGRTWNATDADLPAVVDLAPAGSDRIYALADDGTVHHSPDGSRTWRSRGSPDATVHGIAADPDEPATVLAATSNGLRRSTDGGRTWTIAAFPERPVADVAAAGDGVRYALPNGTLMRSDDAGTSWTEAAPDPRSYDEVATLAHRGRWVAIGTGPGRVAVSQDLGATWRLVGR